MTAAAQSGDHSVAALEHLCRAYWRPLYSFALKSVQNQHDAQDLTQAYFERLLERKFLTDVDRDRGRFRTFLLSSFRNFMANEWDKARAIKRGGAARVFSLNFEDAGSALEPETDTEDAVSIFERKWAETVLARVMERLEKEQNRAGHAQQFAHLRQFIGGSSTETISAVAASLKMTDAAARMAVSRLRQRYGDLLRREISETVASPDDVDDEIRQLLAVFAS